MKLQLEIELTALRREADRKIKKDDASKEKIKQVEEQLAKIDEEIAPILARYAVEKGKAEEIQSVKQVSRFFSDSASNLALKPTPPSLSSHPSLVVLNPTHVPS